MRRARVVAAVLLASLLVLLAACTTTSSSGATSATALGSTTTISAVGVLVQPPAGWTKYSGGGTEIYLPPTFDLNMKDATTVESLRALAPDDAEVASWLSSVDSPAFVIAVGETTSLDSGSGMANVGVMNLGEDAANSSLEEDVDNVVSHIAQAFPSGKVVTRNSLTIDGHEAAQLMIDSGKGFSQLMTYMKAPSGAWAIYMTADTTQMQERLADFQAGLSTFRIAP